MTSVRTSVLAVNCPTPNGRESDEYAPYVQLFCSRNVMNRREAGPPPSTWLATVAAKRIESAGPSARLPTNTLDCTDPGRCTSTISVAVRGGGAANAGAASAVPVHPAKPFVASDFSVGRVMSPATTSSAPCGRRRADRKASRSAREMARTVLGVSLRPYGWSPYSPSARKREARASGFARRNCSPDKVWVRARASSASLRVGRATTSPSSAKASGAAFDNTLPVTLRKSSPANAVSVPPAPSIAAAISSASLAPAPLVRSVATSSAVPDFPFGSYRLPAPSARRKAITGLR